jgi:hypothetical protein
MTYYFYDRMRHLVCVPYSVANLHKMAEDLDIDKCWFHGGPLRAHYDIPKRRVAEIAKRATKVSPRVILKIVKGTVEEIDLPPVRTLPRVLPASTCWCGDIGCRDH